MKHFGCWLLCSFVVLVLVLFCLTKWGPWDTYSWDAGHGDGWGNYTYVEDLPVWFGEILSYTHGAMTDEESKQEEREWLEQDPQRKELWEINEYGRLQLKRVEETNND